MFYIFLLSLPVLFSFPLFHNVYVNRYYRRNFYVSCEPKSEPVYNVQEKNKTVAALEIEQFIINLKKIREEEDKWDCGEVEWEEM